MTMHLLKKRSCETLPPKLGLSIHARYIDATQRATYISAGTYRRTALIDEEVPIGAHKVPLKTDPILLELPEGIGEDPIVLRPWINGQGVAFYEAIEETREEAGRWIPFMSKIGSTEDAEKIIRKWRAQWDLREETMLLSAWSADSGRLVGSAGLVRNDWSIRAFEIGYWIRSSEPKKVTAVNRPVYF